MPTDPAGLSWGGCDGVTRCPDATGLWQTGVGSAVLLREGELKRGNTAFSKGVKASKLVG